MPADTVPDRFEKIGSPPDATDTVSSAPIGTVPFVPDTTPHYAIAGGTPAPVTPIP